MKEAWKDIKGYEGIYQVSNLGKVKSLDKKVRCRGGFTRIFPGRIMRLHSKDRYSKVTLTDHKGQTKTVYVHRLVAEAFIDNPHNHAEVNHKDEDKLNNNVENLEWCDREYNNSYGTRLERQLQNLDYVKAGKKQSATRRRIKYNGIYQIDIDGNIIRKWKTIKEAAKHVGASYYGISNCCRGKAKTAGDYRWEYANKVIVKDDDKCLNMNLISKEIQEAI